LRQLIAIVALLIGSQYAWAELTVTVREAQTIVTVTPEIITQLKTVDGDNIGEAVREVGPSVVNAEKPAAVLSIKSDRDLTKSIVKIRSSTAKAVKIADGLYVVSAPGKHTLQIDVISEGPLQWDDETVTVEVGTPTPEPDPIPDIPEDRFDNIGQRVAVWAAGISGNQQVAAVYAAHADMLRGDPSHSINSVGDSLVHALAALPEAAGFVDVRKNIAADLVQRWSLGGLGRVDLADYYSAIAIGLGGAQ